MASKSGFAALIGIGKPRDSAPPPFGGSKEAEEPEGMAEEVEEHAEGEGIPPEAVAYRDENQVCGACAYMEQDGNCSKLKIPVGPGASCLLFRQTEQGAADMEPDMELEMGTV